MVVASRLLAGVIGLTGMLAGGCVLKAGGDGNSTVDGDAAAPDAASALDSSSDGPAADTGCELVDANVIMYLTMNRPNGERWPDLLGAHDAQSAPNAAGQTPGPNPSCGSAFDGSDDNYLVIADSDAVELDVASIDLYVRVPSPGLERGIVSRDSSGPGPGHFDLIFSPTNQVVARIQAAEDVTAYRCSVAQNEGDWIRIGINVGPPDLEMFIDGQRAQEDTGQHNNVARPCGEPLDSGLGPNNPWVIGASSINSPTGEAEPVDLLLGTAVDELRVSTVRRVY